MNNIQKVLSECLETASAILKRYFAKIQECDFTTKGKNFDLQTVADIEAESAIVTLIQNAFPEHSILTEEAGKLDRPGSSVKWIIDPLDGTSNFRHGVPNCAISIAVEIENEVRLASVFNPFRDELYRAELGSGATCNGKSIHVSTIDTLSDSLIVAGFPYDRRERMDHYIELFKTFMYRTQGVLRMASAAMDLCHVACGRLEAYYEESLSRWDWAAGHLIVKEAGGKVTDYHGGDQIMKRRQICASNALIHKEVLEILGPSVS